MLRQVSSRNQRAKGFRLKHALQIGILVAISIWLLYQVKHSREKKKAYDARNSKLISKVTDNQEDFFKFGRKDLQNEVGTVKGIIQREEEIEDAPEEEETEVKQEEPEDEEVRGAGGDAIDEHDQENAEEAEHGEDSAEDEDKDGQIEEKDLFESQDHEGGTQEAREENYKRDDVSSAVVHDAHATESGTGNGDARSMDEEQMVDDSKVDNDDRTINSSTNNISDNVVNNGTTTDDSPPNNGTIAEGKVSEAEISKADNELMSNSTTVEDANRTDLTNSTTTESNKQMEVLANSTSVSVNQIEGQNNSTVDELDRQVQASNDTLSLDSTQERNSTNDEGTVSEVETKLENVVDPAGKSNSTTSSATEGNGDATTSSGTDGNEDLGLGDSDDLSHVAMEEEKEIRTDLSTLPTIQNEAKNMDEEAAE